MLLQIILSLMLSPAVQSEATNRIEAEFGEVEAGYELDHSEMCAAMDLGNRDLDVQLSCFIIEIETQN